MLLSGLVVLVFLIMAAHGLFIILGICAVSKGRLVKGRGSRTFSVTGKDAVRGGLVYLGFGCVMVAAWLMIAVRAIQALMRPVP